MAGSQRGGESLVLSIWLPGSRALLEGRTIIRMRGYGWGPWAKEKMSTVIFTCISCTRMEFTVYTDLLCRSCRYFSPSVREAEEKEKETQQPWVPSMCQTIGWKLSPGYPTAFPERSTAGNIILIWWTRNPRLEIEQRETRIRLGTRFLFKTMMKSS